MCPGLDTELVMLCFTLLAIVASIMYLILNNFFSKKRKSSSKSKVVSKTAAKERSTTEDKDQWLKGTNAPGASKRVKVRAST